MHGICFSYKNWSIVARIILDCMIHLLTSCFSMLNEFQESMGANQGHQKKSTSQCWYLQHPSFVSQHWATARASQERSLDIARAGS